MEGTILQEILRHCTQSAGRPLHHWVCTGRCEIEETVRYGELGERTRELAEVLLQLTCHRERVVLCYPPGLDFILSLVACLRAGITAGIAVHCSTVIVPGSQICRLKLFSGICGPGCI